MLYENKAHSIETYKACMRLTLGKKTEYSKHSLSKITLIY